MDKDPGGRRKKKWLGVFAALAMGLTLCGALGGLAGCRESTSSASPQNTALPVSDPGSPGFYTYSVQPILQRNCYRCHGWMNHRGGLSLQTRALMLKGGKNGPALVPGDPEHSLLIRLIRHEGPVNHPMPMPPAPRPKLSESDIATLTRWVRAGAITPGSPR